MPDRRGRCLPPRPGLAALFCLSVLLSTVLLSTFVFPRCPAPDGTLGMIPPASRRPAAAAAADVSDGSENNATVGFISRLFPLKDRHGKFFVEAGALDGRTISKSLYLEEAYGWTGLLVEPNPHMFKEMLGSNRSAWLAPYCLSPEGQVVQEVMEYPYTPEEPLMASVGKLGSSHPQNKWIGGGNATTYSALVTCHPLHALLDALGVDTVHYFSLDVEGVELKVLQTVPFHRIKFQVIEVEFFYMSAEEKATTKELLQSRGFRLVSDGEHRDTFVFVDSAWFRDRGVP